MNWMRAIWKDSIASNASPQTDAALLVGRVLTVAALIPNGLRKLATFAQTSAAMGGSPQIIDGRPFPAQTPLLTFPMPEVFLGASIFFDLAGALLIILGWRTRAISTLLVGYVLIAMTIFHGSIRGAEDLQHIVRNLSLVGALVLLSGVGGGRWSLDGARAGKVSSSKASGR